MSFFLLRHRKTGKMMPQLNGRGYSSWEPDHPDPERNWPEAAVPRLFHSKAAAAVAASNWYKGVYVRHRDEGSWPDYELSDDLTIEHQAHRKQGDLEIIEVILVQSGQLELPL